MRISILSILLLVVATTEIIYAQKNKPTYNTYKGLVMAGYQGWFGAPEDGADRGWYHYTNEGKFEPGYSSIDFWPDVSEYKKTYQTKFPFQDGSFAETYSSYDESSVNLHFKWMKQYGIDGVFMQRFVGEIKREKSKRHLDKVLESALKAAKKYNRAICIMYDLSGCKSSDMEFLEQDWKELQEKFELFDLKKNPTYLHHNSKPLLSVWGVGFNDGRRYSISDAGKVIDGLKNAENPVSIMLGIPYYWRELRKDTEKDAKLYDVIKKSDIILPWAVGRYGHHGNVNTESMIKKDIEWCQENGVDYVPLIFPGFTWGNLTKQPDKYDQIPRNSGKFFWDQVSNAKRAGAEMLYIAMFDEVDEGTAIFKCLRRNEVPLNGDKKFVGINNELENDHYLWLTGQAAKWIRGDKEFKNNVPKR